MDDAAERHPVPTVSLDRLKVVSAVGRGAKGVVFLVQSKGDDDARDCGEHYWALKVILRENIEKKKYKKKNNKSDDSKKATSVEEEEDGEDEYRRIAFEQEVLKQFDHPLLPKLRAVLSTDRVVGYAIDYCPGSDLNSLRKKQTEKMFSDDIIRFYAAELVLALEYLHSLGIVYRDLKPENVMIQSDGHIMLVDFDLSTKLSPQSAQPSPIAGDSIPKQKPKLRSVNSSKRLSPFHQCCYSVISPDDDESVELGLNSVFPMAESNSAGKSNSQSKCKSNSFVGTEEYVPPEIIQGNGHDFAVDWWSLGVFLHEMLYGTTPFRGTNRKETFYRILAKEPELVGEPTPLRDLIRRLLEKDPKQRISVDGIKAHDFFRGLDWDSVVGIQRPPHVPVFDETSEGRGGSEIDVEAFAEGIFSSGEGEKKQMDDENNGCGGGGGGGGDGGGGDAVNSKKAWVEGLSDHRHNRPSSANDFLVF